MSQLVMQIEVTPYSSVHMMWLLPQYFIITAGEVMFSVTGLQFSFTQVIYLNKKIKDNNANESFHRLRNGCNR